MNNTISVQQMNRIISYPLKVAAMAIPSLLCI